MTPGSTAPTSTDISTVELCRVAQVSYRQLDHWTRCGMVETVGNPRPGSGVVRRYAPAEVGVCRLLRALVHSVGQDPLSDAVDRVRKGERGMYQLFPGVWLDLDVICGPA